MTKPRLLLDTNIVIDFLNQREPFYEDARLLMILGRLGEFELWVSSSQVTDLVYILSDGGRAQLIPEVLEQLRDLRGFVNVYAAGEREVDAMLAKAWRDPEDSLLYEVAIALRATALLSRNQRDFPEGLIPVLDCGEFFAWWKEREGVVYGEVDF
ncbi:PIN domain-containing protein [Parvibacter caecicola]|mgnify:CR=1 FL=1|uniref:PIN domain-containing protein n=1 Tax=Parvibacter caecicola TaxID=747645 RepID=A0A4T9TH33_9ACTN|nr:PIN domain-containing protein [Parvibacter caecicola]TJW10184.1 PIN domain-containing protein [Parvibacter caecicola]